MGKAAGKPGLQPLAALLRLLTPWRGAADFLTVHGGLLVCLLFLLVGLGLAGDYGVGRDEWLQRGNARVNLDYMLGRGDFSGLRIEHDRVYGVAFELPLLLAERVLGLADYYEVHRLRLSLTHLFFIVGAYCWYRLAWRLFNNRAVAVAALLLFLLHPRIYAHSFVNSKDLPFLSMFAVTLYLLERALRRDTAAAFALLGVAVGALTNLRIMGVMLLAAVPAMRGLDLWYAAGGRERKDIRIKVGVFAAAALGTVYILSPYAWLHPLDYVATALSLPVNHPNVLPVLFQGELIPSDELPPHYGATWFLISTPPAFLLLGLLGMAAVLAWGLKQPGTALRDTRLRYGLLLLAGFGLPLLAAAALGSNMAAGWRQLYFMYAPFSLLAAGGLGWLLAALAERRFWRMAVYGLAVLGAGWTALQIVQLHPHQYGYFNFLVNRGEPGYLQSRYELDYWGLSLRAGTEYLLERHPDRELTVGELQLDGRILPAAARERLSFGVYAAEPDYDLVDKRAAHRADLGFNSAAAHWLYGNELVRAQALTEGGMTAAAVAGYEGIYRQATAGEPLLRGEFDIYLEGRRLVWVREDCPAGGAAAGLGVKVYKAGPGLRPGRLPDMDGYSYLDAARVRLGDRCMAVLELPDYSIAHILAGRRGPEGRAVWGRLHSFGRPSWGEVVGGLEESGAGLPQAGVGFGVYLEEGRLIYYRDKCRTEDAEARFFLHIVPEDGGSLGWGRRRHGFENRDFDFARRGEFFDGQCLATVPLPGYGVGSIRTGQFAPGQGELWVVELDGAGGG